MTEVARSVSNPAPANEASAIDTHCHLFLIERDPAEVLSEARGAGVERIVCPGVDLSSSRHAVDLAESFDGVFATAGTHPHDASEFDLQTAERIAELLARERVVAVGECGLDFFRMRSPKEDQIRALRVHAHLARETNLPMVVHVRDAWDEILQVLDEGDVRDVVVHCFTGDVATARACVSRGWYLSFAGNVTYPKNARMREAAAAIAMDRLLVETDSPFLAPQRLRGRDNAPANVVDVIETVAAARGEAVEEVRAATLANAFTAFPRLR
jgi:TatD DNase family protein